MKFTIAISEERTAFLKNPLLMVCFFGFLAFWASTLIGTSDLSNWVLENTLTFLFIATLALTYRRYKFSDLSYLLIFIYIMLHVYGAKYTYAENPLGYWLQDVFHTSRNHYDRIVHFSFGLLLAYPMREIFLNVMKWPKWVAIALPVEITLSFSGMYELIEWSVADVFFPEQGMAYLGTQGDIWDAQKDMGLAFSGALLIMTSVFIIRKVFKITK